MKKLFTIIAVASMMLTTVFGFTSCQKDEMPTPAPQQTYINNNSNSNATPIVSGNTTTVEEQNAMQQMNYFGYQLFVNDEVLALGDIVVTAKYDGKTVEYKASEGQTASVDMTSELNAKDKMELKGNVEYSGKKLVVPAFQAGSHSASFSWKFVPNDAAFSTLDMEGTTELVVLSAGMASNSNNISLDVTDVTSISAQSSTTYNKNGDVLFSRRMPNSKVQGYFSSKSMFSGLKF